MNYRRDIDGLRAVAVLPVVLYHAGVPGPSGGYVGVDVFFVISGYLITAIVAREIGEGRFSLISFYERRARRILPALAAMVAVVLAFGWAVLLPAEITRLGGGVATTALFVSNLWFALTQDYFGPAAEFEPLLHTWSLAVEEQFYLFFPPLLMGLFALARVRAVVLIVAALCLGSLVLAEVGKLHRPSWVFYLIVFRAWELGAGALLALARPAPPRAAWLRQGLGLAGLAAILVPVFVYHPYTSFPGLAALPPVLGAAVLIWVGSADRAGPATRLLSLAPMVWIGLVSYSLYLWHWPVLAYARILNAGVTLPGPIAALAVVLSLCLAWASWRFVERPFRRPAPEGYGRGAIFAASGAALVAMTAAGAALWTQHGFPARVAPEVLRIAAAAGDVNPMRGCFGADPRADLCRIGRTAGQAGEGPADFLFWGDSHADAMLPGVARAAVETGRTGYFAGDRACLPVLDVHRRGDGPRCSDYTEATLSFLEARRDMPLVVLAARWTIWVEGSRYGGEAGAPIAVDWTGPPDAAPRGTENAAVIEAGLARLVDRILATGRRVAILGPVPEAGFDVPLALARSLHLDLAEPPTVTRAAFETRNGRTEAILARLAGTRPGVVLLPVSAVMCDADICRLRDARGLPLYADDDHLTRSAAETILQPLLKNILSAP